MSYQTYMTQAIVCGSYDRMTADRTYLLFTETAGMLYATARSAREERSKQRYALQDFSLIQASLVKGKGGWRIGSVEALGNFYTAAPDRAARGGIRSTVALVRRFLTGEDAQSQVFTDTVDMLTALNTPRSDVPVLTEYFTLRLLAHLGYIAPHPSYQPLLATNVWWEETTPLGAAATKAITQALHDSHL